MPNPFRRSASSPAGPLFPALLLCLLTLTAAPAIGQATAPPSALEKQLDRIDFAISVSGVLTDSVSGTEQRDHIPMTVDPSNTVGELVTLRYITPHPLIGFELNYANARFTENYISNPTLIVGGAQAAVNEYTLGYVAHPPKLFGIGTYVGAGGGTIRFKPTPYGGQGLPTQYRAAYYYDAGLENTFPNSHFGVRLGFRQLIYLAPDFIQNYLTITRRARTTEPSFGFFVHF